jgi:hypothetical protein
VWKVGSKAFRTGAIRGKKHLPKFRDKSDSGFGKEIAIPDRDR